MTPDRSPRALSVFSGAGGLDLGLEAAGFQHLGFIEQCALSRATLTENRPHWRHLRWHDVLEAARECQAKDLELKVGELDLLAGAPPCQPFSAAAQWTSNGRLGLQDRRADTLQAFLTLAERLLPKAILMENVPAFWTARHGARAVIDRFFRRLELEKKARYRLEVKIVNAADYAVPQIRRRAILVALRDGQDFAWPEPAYLKKPMTAWDALHRIRPNAAPASGGRWANLLPSIPEGRNYLWHTDRGEGESLFGYRTRFWSFLLKLAKDKPAWTLAAQPGPGTGPFHWENRPLATEEMLALQTFPSTWRLSGTYRDHLRLIGNATPPLLAECLGRSLVVALGGKSSSVALRYLPALALTPPPPGVLGAVPAEYRKLIKAYPAHAGPGLGPSPREESSPAEASA